MLTPFVVLDAVVDVAGPPSGSSAIAVTSLLLLESVLKLLQEESILLDLGLELTELFQVRALRLWGGEGPVLHCRWDNA